MFAALLQTIAVLEVPQLILVIAVLGELVYAME